MVVLKSIALCLGGSKRDLMDNCNENEFNGLSNFIALFVEWSIM